MQITTRQYLQEKNISEENKETIIEKFNFVNEWLEKESFYIGTFTDYYISEGSKGISCSWLDYENDIKKGYSRSTPEDIRFLQVCCNKKLHLIDVLKHSKEEIVHKIQLIIYGG